MEQRTLAEFVIVSVNVAKPKVLLQWSGGDVISSIDKQPVDTDELELTFLNLDGDEQADTRGRSTRRVLG